MKKPVFSIMFGCIAMTLLGDVKLWWRCDDMPAGSKTVAGESYLGNKADAEKFAGVPREHNSGQLTSAGAQMPEYREAFPRGYYICDPLTGLVYDNRTAIWCGSSSGLPTAKRSGCVTVEDGGLYGDSFTIEFFLRCDKYQTSTWETILARLNDAGETSFYLRQLNGGFKSGYAYLDENGDRKTVENSSYNCWKHGDLLDENWHHLAMSVNQKNMKLKLYVDYQLAVDAQMPGRLDVDEPGMLRLGCGTDTWGGDFSGLLDEVRVVEGVLAPENFLRVQLMDSPDVLYYVPFGALDGTFKPFSAEGNSLFNYRSVKLVKDVASAAKAEVEPVALAQSLQPRSSEPAHENACAAKLNHGFLTFPCNDPRLCTGDFTVEAMFRLPEDGIGDGEQCYLIAHGSGIIVQCVGRRLQVKDPNWTGLWSESIDPEKWNHIAYSVDRTNGKVAFYFNYRLVGRWDVKIKDFAENSNLVVGAYDKDGALSFNTVYLDEIRISGGARSQSDFICPVQNEEVAHLTFTFPSIHFASYGFGFGASAITRDSWGQGYTIDDANLPGSRIYDGWGDAEGVPNGHSAGFSGNNYGGAYVIPDAGLESFSKDSFTAEMFVFVADGTKLGATEQKVMPTFIGQKGCFRIEYRYLEGKIAVVGPDGEDFASAQFGVGRWCHLAYVQDVGSDELRFYVNRRLAGVKKGIPAATGEKGDAVYVMGSPLENHLGTFCAARADEVRLVARALSPEEFLMPRRKRFGTNILLK